MILYLLRHGSTEGSGRANPSLSPDGRNAALKAGNLIFSAGGRLDSVFASPLARSVETARLIAGVAGGVVTVVESLEPEGNELETLQILASCGKERAAVVGHLPQLRRMVSALISDAHPLSMHLDPGCPVCIEADFTTGQWSCTMLWATDVELMRHMSFQAGPDAGSAGRKGDK